MRSDSFLVQTDVWREIIHYCGSKRHRYREVHVWIPLLYVNRDLHEIVKSSDEYRLTALSKYHYGVGLPSVAFLKTVPSQLVMRGMDEIVSVPDLTLSGTPEPQEKYLEVLKHVVWEIPSKKDPNLKCLEQVDSLVSDCMKIYSVLRDVLKYDDLELLTEEILDVLSKRIEYVTVATDTTSNHSISHLCYIIVMRNDSAKQHRVIRLAVALHSDNDPFYKNEEDWEVGLVAVRTCHQRFNLLSNNLTSDRTFIMEAIRWNPKVLNEVHQLIDSDSIIQSMDQAIDHPDRRYPVVARRLHKLMQNREFVLLLVKRSVEAIYNLIPEMRNDREIGLAAVRNDGTIFNNLSDDLRSDYQITLIAVHQDGRMLQYASDELKNNEYIVREAIQNCPKAIKYASKSLHKSLKSN
jgi:hypothetical protein